MNRKELDESYTRLRDELFTKIKTWDDLYTYFDQGMDRVGKTLHPVTVFDVLLTMYAFFDAMRELPEEGDVQVLLDRAIRTLVYEAQERLGFEVYVAPGNTAEERYEALRRKVEESQSATTEETPTKPRTLH